MERRPLVETYYILPNWLHFKTILLNREILEAQEIDPVSRLSQYNADWLEKHL